MKSGKPAARPLTLVLPATSANLGPAFDAAALAFNLFLKVRATPASTFSVRARGRDAELCGRLDKHLILSTYREVLQAEGREVIPVALRLNNEIPVGKGCGSSAAARLAGIALATHFGRLNWSDARIVGEASLREHHPDNSAACWMGGLAIARVEHGEAKVAHIAPRGRWPLLLVLPAETLPTEDARRVLPAHYSRADAVANLQNSMLLLAAFSLGRPDLLTSALDDRLHQPYRAPLCPLLPALQKLAGTRGVLGVALSGAGPSVLVFLDPRTSPAGVRRRIARHLNREGLTAELLLCEITTRGACYRVRGQLT